MYIEFMAALIKAMSRAPEALIGWLGLAILKVLSAATIPEVLFVFLVGLGVTVLAAEAFTLLHVMLARARTPRARVFISYEHGEQDLASSLNTALIEREIDGYMMPFRQDAEHDSVLHDVHKEIGRSNVIVCIPGKRTSFVETEVAIATALEKPILFILDETSRPYVPNSAMKGYPVFERRRVDEERSLATLAEFCSYLAGDAHSTRQLYRSIRYCLSEGLVFIGMVFLLFVSLVAVDVETAESVWAATAIASAFSMSFFLLAFGAFFGTRVAVRKEVGRIVRGRRFDARLLPDVLQYSLRRESLFAMQFGGPVAAFHERGGMLVSAATFIKMDRGKVLFILLNTLLVVTVAYASFSLALFYGVSIELIVSPTWIALWAIGWLVCGLYFLSWVVRDAKAFHAAMLRKGIWIDCDGIRDDINNSDRGIIDWRTVTDATHDSEAMTVTLTTGLSSRPIVLEAEYLHVEAESLLELINDRRAMPR